MGEAPQIRREYRVRRIRTSISVPEDVDAWVRWKAAKDGVPISSVYAQAVTNWSIDSAIESAFGADKNDRG